MELNKNLVDKIMMSVSSVGESNFYLSSTQLDSHANMVLIVKQVFVFSHSGKHADVQDFSKEVKGLPEVPIVDAVIAYDCPSSGYIYLLIVRNALCVPTMDVNLIPPFVLIEVGLIFNYMPKIHFEYPSVEDHSLFYEETGLIISFNLNGTFLMFETRSLTEYEIENAENYPSIFLTLNLNKWGTYDESYKLNEDSYFDNRGDMILPTISTENTLVADADLLAAVADFNDDDYMATASNVVIEKLN